MKVTPADLWLQVGSFSGVALLAYLSIATHHPLIAAPLGATVVLTFAVPTSPFAQPRNIIGGNGLGALVSLLVLHSFGNPPWAMATAVAITFLLMQLCRMIHPPGAAIALLGVMSQAHWSFLFTPVLAGSLTVVLYATAYHRWVLKQPYPSRWL
uniref:HPP family protein n=1 Tax=Cyanothece sp. (strain PCC 7425 / ATCC 29141) TaxID=395961 RepID=B8HWW0_CYAP4